MKIGIFLPNWVGDAAMATPALRAIRKHHASARVVGIMRPHLAGLLAGTRWLDESIFFHPHNKDRRLHSLSVLARLRRERFDQLIFCTNSLRAAVLGWLAGAPSRVGYVRYGRGPFLTTKLFPPKVDGKLAPYRMVDYYLQLAYAIGCEPESPHVELVTSAEDRRHADEVFRRLDLREPYVTFNCSGAYGASKLWPLEYYAALGRRIAEELDHDVLVICGPGERERAAEIAHLSGHPRVHSLAEERLTFGLNKESVRRSRLLVTTDSGPRQYAVAFNVPIVGVCGSFRPIWGQNPLASELSLRVELDCAPCERRKCPLSHHRCMRDLSVETVFAGVRQQLQSNRVAEAA